MEAATDTRRTRTLGRLVVSVPSLAFLGMNGFYILYFLWSCVPVHRKFREIFLATGWEIPARSRTILSIPSWVLVAIGVILLAILIAKERLLQSPVVALILNVAAWFLLPTLFHIWYEGIFAVQDHAMGPR